MGGRKKNKHLTSTTRNNNKYAYYPESSVECIRCENILTHYKAVPGQLCRSCKLQEWQTNLNDEQFSTCHYEDSFQIPPPNVTTFDNNITNDFVNQHDNSRVETWERRIYATPHRAIRNFDHNKKNENVHSTSGIYRTVNFKSEIDNQTNILSGHQQNDFYINSQMSNKEDYSTAHSNYSNKRKRDTDREFSKKIRTTIPQPVQSSSIEPYYKLNLNIWNYFKENSQTDEMFNIKMCLRSRLQRLIQSKYPDAELFNFGSSITGFASKTSDVDVSLIFGNREIGKKKVINFLWELRALLIKENCFKRLEVIPAKVAILRFRDTVSGFEVDLNINNPTGIRNSQLLRSYARLDVRVRPLILFIKSWARRYRINDAKSGTLSSYSLGLMTIHYLQYRCSPPVLPSLQKLQPDKYLPDSNVRLLRVDEDLPYFRSENIQTPGQLFAGFIHYYANEYDYKNSRISVRLGDILPRVEKRENKKHVLKHWIDIEEPFEKTNNVARSTNSPRTSEYIKSVFNASWKQLANNREMCV